MTGTNMEVVRRGWGEVVRRFAASAAVVTAIVLAGAPGAAFAGTTASRFPKPEFSVRYAQPETTVPSPRAVFHEYVDVIVLAVALLMAAYLGLKARSRRGIWLLSLFSILYFGFWRKGCVCPVGSIQNITAALTDPAYAVPFTVALFFLLPILATLVFGRTFCAAVCPLGAIQDMFAFRPVRVPDWVAGPLGLVPYAYLALAVLFVATGTGFIVCQYDPFIGFYRLDASLGMVVTGVAMLLLGVFVARPYCRFLCPYGVILNWASRFSWKHVTITPTDCVKCRLCENACPFGAIEKPTPEKMPEPRSVGRRRLSVLLVMVPVAVVAGGLLFAVLSGPMSGCHRTVALAERVVLEDSGAVKGTTLESEAFRSGGQSKADLIVQASEVRRSFWRWGWLTGGFLGLAAGLSLVGLAMRRSRAEYEIDRGSCLSCARCFEYCPREHEELGKAGKGKGNAGS